MKYWKTLLVSLLAIGILFSVSCELEETLGLKSDESDSSTGEFSTTATIQSFREPRPNEEDIHQVWVLDNGKELAITDKTVFWIEAPSCSSSFIGTIQEFHGGDIIEYRWDKEDMIIGVFGTRIYPTDVIRSCENYPKDEPDEDPEPEPCCCCP